jgi:hypothetical protein
VGCVLDAPAPAAHNRDPLVGRNGWTSLVSSLARQESRRAALTAILQSEKLILPRSGEALTLGVPPRGFLKRQRGATFGPPLPLYASPGAASSSMDPLRATIKESAAADYTHVECFCPRRRVIRLRPMDWLPRISMGLTIAQLSERLRCAECGGQLLSVKPWRQADVLRKPLGRRG